MKNHKLGWGILVLLLVVILCACGQENHGITTGGSETESIHASTQNPPAFVMIGKARLSVGIPASDVLSLLGAPVSEDHSPSCGGFDGDDVLYTYENLLVGTTPGKSGDVISLFALLDDTYATEEGIRVGDSESAALSAYGTPTTDNGDPSSRTVTYSRGDTTILIRFRNGSVSWIQYQIGE